MEDYRARFVEIYNKNITRPGADRLDGHDGLFHGPGVHPLPRRV